MSVPRPLTEDCESENHVLHDFIADHATRALRCLRSGFQMALIHPDLHLFYLLHFVGTEISEELISVIDDHSLSTQHYSRFLSSLVHFIYQTRNKSF